MRRRSQICGILTILTSCTVCHQTLIAQEGFWRLQAGNQFNVEITTNRTTKLAINNGPVTTNSVQEVVELQYVVNRVRPTGLEFEVRVTDVNRDQK